MLRVRAQRLCQNGDSIAQVHQRPNPGSRRQQPKYVWPDHQSSLSHPPKDLEGLLQQPPEEELPARPQRYRGDANWLPEKVQEESHLGPERQTDDRAQGDNWVGEPGGAREGVQSQSQVHLFSDLRAEGEEGAPG